MLTRENKRQAAVRSSSPKMWRRWIIPVPFFISRRNTLGISLRRLIMIFDSTPFEMFVYVPKDHSSLHRPKGQSSNQPLLHERDKDDHRNYSDGTDHCDRADVDTTLTHPLAHEE